MNPGAYSTTSLLTDAVEPAGGLAASRFDPSRAMALRKEGWGYERIGREFGLSEGGCFSAMLPMLCRDAGGTPAKRDSSGGLLITEVKRMRRMMLDGAKSVDICVAMAVSPANVTHQRRKFEAELKAERKGKLLPPPGGGKAYSGVKVPTAKRREVEALFAEGLGRQKVHERSGVSLTTVTRIRARMVKRLARKGQALAGCDTKGRRLVVLDHARHIPETAIAELRRRILSREPVRRAANDLGIGLSSAYKVRDTLSAELTAKGETLAKPILPGRSSREARKAQWLPKDRLFEFRALVRKHGHDDAKRLLLEKIAADRQAEARRPKSFEEQLAAVRAGAALTNRVALVRPDPSYTLGGVATGAL